MPWTIENPPAVAQNWNLEERTRCVEAANAVLSEGGTDQEAIFACIHAAGKGTNPMKRKIYRAPFTLKAEGDEGNFTAVFATLNVKDHDGDVTPEGAFEEGQEVIIEPWNHGWNLPVGKGAIHADAEKAWVEGAFFLETAGGKDHYQVIKNMGGLQEWSYTFDILESSEGNHEGDRVRFLEKMDVVGVSPVTRGAGIDTRTTSIKNEKTGDNGEPEPREDTGASVKRQIDTLLIEIEAAAIELEAAIT